MRRIGRPLAMPTEDRRKEIHAAAERLFGARGYEKVTMSDIATEAGMSKKTLYVHFADKQALLKSLVASSYVWPEANGPEADAGALAETASPDDAVAGLEARLRVIADHVLSERHLRLCRLAIGESIGIAGLADTFYRMGIEASRESLIAAVGGVETSMRVLDLDDRVLADMLFGATMGKALIDALLTGVRPDMADIYRSIERMVPALFVPSGKGARRDRR